MPDCAAPPREQRADTNIRRSSWTLVAVYEGCVDVGNFYYMLLAVGHHLWAVALMESVVPKNSPL